MKKLLGFIFNNETVELCHGVLNENEYDFVVETAESYKVAYVLYRTLWENNAEIPNWTGGIKVDGDIITIPKEVNISVEIRPAEDVYYGGE